MNMNQSMNNPEAVVLEYIAGWKAGDRDQVLACLHQDCVIRESTGAQFTGHSGVVAWIDGWVRDGYSITKWEVRHIVAAAESVAVEWEFSWICGATHELLGASVFRFREGLIVFSQEYRREH